MVKEHISLYEIRKYTEDEKHVLFFTVFACGKIGEYVIEASEYKEGFKFDKDPNKNYCQKCELFKSKSLYFRVANKGRYTK